MFPNRYSIVTPILAIKKALQRSSIRCHRTLRSGDIRQMLGRCGMKVISEEFLSIGKYRSPLDALASGFVRWFLPVWCREEIVLVAAKEASCRPGDSR